MLKKLQGKLLFDPPEFIEVSNRHSKRSDFEFLKKLGDGSFSQVWRVKHKKTQQVFAIKQVRKAKVSNTISQFRREVEILYKISHPHIIKLFSHFEDEKCFYLIMELMEGGTLFQKLYREKTFIENVAAQFFREVVLAIEFLHSQTPAIIHRDIKPENIMIDKDMRVKLIDFGWANFVLPSTLRHTYCGTSEYMPPEIVSNKGHSLSSDIWCMGILLYEMLMGHTPFKSTDKHILNRLINDSKLKFSDKVSNNAKTLLIGLLDKNPNTRFTVSEVKNSQWLIGIPPIRKTIKQEIVNIKTVKIDVSEMNDTGSSDSDSEFRSKFLRKHRKSEEKIKKSILKGSLENLTLKKRIDKVKEEIEIEMEKFGNLEQEIVNKKKMIFRVSCSSKELLSNIFDMNLEFEKFKGEDLNELYEKRVEIQGRLLEVSKDCKIKKNILENLRKKVGKESVLFANYEIQLQKLQISCKNLQNLSGFGHSGEWSNEKELKDQIGLLKNELDQHPEKSQCLSSSELQQATEITVLVNSNLAKNSDFSGEINKKLENLEEKIQELENNIQDLRIGNELKKYSLNQSFRTEKNKILQRAKCLAERNCEDYRVKIAKFKEKMALEIENAEVADSVADEEVEKRCKRVKNFQKIFERLEKIDNRKRNDLQLLRQKILENNLKLKHIV